MKIDTYAKTIIAFFIIWLFVNSFLVYRSEQMRRSVPQPFADTFYLYFNGTIPYRMNAATGDVWALARDTGSWRKVLEPEEIN